MPQSSEVLTVQEVADRLRISKTSAYRLLNSGAIRGIKAGRVWRVPSSSVDDYISRGGTPRSMSAPMPILEEADDEPTPSGVEVDGVDEDEVPPFPEEADMPRFETEDDDQPEFDVEPVEEMFADAATVVQEVAEVEPEVRQEFDLNADVTDVTAPAKDNAYRSLLDGHLPSDEFVREACERLETDCRRLALSALADWEFLRRNDNRLTTVIASLRRPSWDVLHQLLGALDGAVAQLETEGAADTLNLTPTLMRALDLFRRPVSKDVARAMEPMAEFTRIELPENPTWGEVLALPVSLSYRMLQEEPEDVRWWSFAGNALAPLIQVLSIEDVFADALSEATWPAPWFFHEDDRVWSYYGLSRKRLVKYVSDEWRVRREQTPMGEIVSSFQTLLGRDEPPSGDYRKFLGRMARREFIGVIIGDYLMGAPEERRGRSNLHLARRLSTGERVVLRVLDADVDEAACERFVARMNEARTTGTRECRAVLGCATESWSAPRRLPITDRWFKEFAKGGAKRTFAALAAPHGQTLEETLALGGPLEDIGAGVRWMAAAADKLAALHARDVLHLGVTPDNVLVSLANEVSLGEAGSSTLDQARALGESTSYRAPEELRGDAPGPTADLWSLCAAFWETFTGKRVYGHDARDDADEMKKSGVTPADARDLRPELPARLGVLLSRGLSPDPAHRFGSASELSREARAVLEELDGPLLRRSPRRGETERQAGESA